MSRYIDADAFVKNMSEIKESTLQNHSLKRGNEPIDGYDADFLRAIGLAKQLVDEFPATDVRPNVKGKWLPSNQHGFIAGCTIELPDVCSVCGRSALNEPWHFCPNCGADMRGEE